MVRLATALASLVGRIAPRHQLSAAAKEERRKDRQGLPSEDPDPAAVVDACFAWLRNAQDQSASRDHGVARDFSLLSGWSSSYPETTGYIVPTVLRHARDRRDTDLLERGRRMLDWLVSIQFREGGFQGGTIDARPRVPVTFNTGQILLGLAAGVETFGERYREPMNRAAAWLRGSLDPDGCWRKYPTPFAAPGEKAYETHAAWALFEADRLEPGSGYAEAGLRQVGWALTKQRANGWFADCCLIDPARPLTHTLGYALRGVLEAYVFSQSPALLQAARLTADGLGSALRPNGHLPGCLDEAWRPAVKWACLTGSAQIAYCWLMLYRITGDAAYRDAGLATNRYVRRTIAIAGREGICGGVKGSFPVDGEYGAYQYLSWAAKFCIDANVLELEIARDDARGKGQE